MTIPDIEMWSSRLVEDEDGAPLPESAQVAFAQAVCDVVEDLRSTNAGDERDGVWEEGYADACHDILAALAGTQADASVTSLPCPTCQGRSRETVGMVCQTCGRDYGAGTQNDDGAVSDDSATAENRPLPAPSSPDRIDTTEAVRLATEALWVTEHYPVDENDMRLPSADHPDCVGMEVMSYPSAAAAVTAALPALAEQFAALIVRGIYSSPCEHPDCEAERRIYEDAARLVREAAEVTPLRPTVLGEVAAERSAQNAKWGEQNHPDGHGRNLYPWYPSASGARARCDQYAAEGSVTWADIFAEEVCEANEEGDDPTRLRAELIQVAAVAVAWVECIDRREAAEVTG